MTGSPPMSLPSASASRPLVLLVGRRIEQLAQIDRLGLAVGQLDADDVAARHHRDAHRDGAHRAGDVVGEADDARRLDAGRRLQLVERDDRAGAHLHDLAAHAEILEHGFEQPRVLLQRLLVDGRGLGGRRLAQEIERRQDRLLSGSRSSTDWRSCSARRPGPAGVRPRGDKTDDPRARRRFSPAIGSGFRLSTRGGERCGAPAGPVSRQITGEYRLAPLARRLCRGGGAGTRAATRGSAPPAPEQLPAPANCRRGAAARDARDSRRAAPGAATEQTPVTPRQSDDQQQQQPDQRRRHHRDRQRRAGKPDQPQQPLRLPADEPPPSPSPSKSPGRPPRYRAPTAPATRTAAPGSPARAGPASPRAAAASSDRSAQPRTITGSR